MNSPKPSLADLKRDLRDLSPHGDDPRIPEDPLLLEDLELDSLAMAELLVLLEETYDLTGRRVELMTRDWRGITASQLYEECCRNGT